MVTGICFSKLREYIFVTLIQPRQEAAPLLYLKIEQPDLETRFATHVI